MITFLKWLGIAMSIGLIGLAAVLAHTPWRVHGGRFATEYLLLASPFAVVGVIVLVLSLRAGGSLW
jgi:hypothetical protein